MKIEVQRPSPMTMGHTDPPHSDYQSVFLNMRVQWNELVASHIQRENTWRITAWMALGVALVCAGGLVYCGTQNKLVPYVVQVDKLGSAVAVQRAGQAAPVDSRIIRAQLGAWIESVRSIYQDAGAERVNLKSAYAMIRHSDGAYRTLNDYFIQHDPFQLAQSQGVSVEISTVQPISEKTWQVQWRETVHSPKGDELSVTPMQANLTVSISPPTDEATLLVNPMGVYITQFNWSPRL